LVVVRIVSYSFPESVDKDFSSNILITQPITVEENQVVVRSVNYTVRSYNLPYPVQVGDIIKVSGSRYYKSVYAKEITYVGPSKLKALYIFKARFLQASNIMLVEPYSSLLNGMLLGADPVISPEFKDALIKVGVIHIIVVSGYNISILFAFASKLLGGSSIKVKTLVGSAAVIFYCVVVGLEPPVMRALIMGLLVGISRAFGHAKDMTYVLLLSACLVLLIDPSNINNVSFLLTFTASLGLILLAEPLTLSLEKYSRVNKTPYIIKESIITSFVAQIYVLPIVSYYFGRVSLIGFIVNPLVVWLVPFIMLVGFVFVCAYNLGLYALIKPFIFILSAFLMLFVDIVQIMSHIPYAQLELSFNVSMLITYYILLAAFTYLIIKQSNRLKVSYVT
jgi:competence protein ComEC